MINDYDVYMYELSSIELHCKAINIEVFVSKHLEGMNAGCSIGYKKWVLGYAIEALL